MTQKTIDSLASKVKEFIENLSPFKKREPPPPEYVLPDSWVPEGGQKPVQKVKENPPPIKTFKLWKFNIPFRPIPVPIPKYKIPHLLKAKRIIAGLLFIVGVMITFVSFFTAPLLSVLFFLNSFILLDYLWKTRSKIVSPWAKKGEED